MKKSRKILSILIAMITMLNVFVTTSFAYNTSGVWEYYVAEEAGEVYIVGCDSSLKGDVVLPERIKGLPVTIVDGNAFENAEGPIKSITISKNIIYFGDYQDLYASQSPFTYLTDLEKIIVVKENKYYSSDSNGVLYDKGKTKLILYPQNCKAKSYTYPDTVVETFNYAFNNPYVETVTISSNVVIIDYSSYVGPFAWCHALKKFVVSPNNPEYSCDKNGILFDKDKTVLICCPQSSPVTEYTVPSSVKEIGDCAFQRNNNLKKIDLNNVEGICFSAFSICMSLTEVIIPKTVRYVSSFDECPSLRKISYEGTKSQWANVHGSDEVIFNNIVFLGEKSSVTPTNKAENIVTTTDKNGVTVEKSDDITDITDEEVYENNSDYDVNNNYDVDDYDYDSDYSGEIDVKSDNKILKIVLPIVAVVLVLIAVIVLIIIKNKKDKPYFEKTNEAQVKTVQKERTLSENDIPGFVNFLNENKSEQPTYNPEEDDYIPYKPEEVNVPVEGTSQEDEKTDSYFEYKPEMGDVPNKENAEKSESTKSDEKTQSWFDSTDI